MSHLSKLSNLTQLSLKGCLALEEEPCLEVLTKLKVLDFSGTAVNSLPSVDKLIHFRKFLLRGCSRLGKLPSLKSLSRMQVLDLSGTGIKELPDGILDLTYLNHLDLPDLKVLQEVGWDKVKHIPEELNWDQCSITEPVQILLDGEEKPCILVNGTKFFQALRENPELREMCLKQMSLSVCPMNQDNYSNNYPLRDELMNNIYFQLRHFSDCKEQRQTMEIRGFDEFPTGLDNVLKDVEYLSLVENPFMSRLSDLGIVNLRKIKGFWLEKCSKLKSILCDETDVKLGEDLEILWISIAKSMQ
ncbi:hypothetical protein RCOM_0865550 [Ricinus communis]|uniref:Leucine-rich repeat-containing protein n=1 Tax=Ricinus communis TaxID=3988 RepID=B9S1J5_RICCO|nr:hypothetical protein RCOM_0865550 [Ricinus communis]